MGLRSRRGGDCLRPLNTWRSHLGTSLVIALIFSATLLAFVRHDDAFSEAACARPFAFIGAMCYSVYLIHWPVTRLIGVAFSDVGLTRPWYVLTVVVPVSSAFSVAAATVFYRLVESRFHNPSIERCRASAFVKDRLEPATIDVDGSISTGPF